MNANIFHMFGINHPYHWKRKYSFIQLLLSLQENTVFSCGDVQANQMIIIVQRIQLRSTIMYQITPLLQALTFNGMQKQSTKRFDGPPNHISELASKQPYRYSQYETVRKEIIKLI